MYGLKHMTERIISLFFEENIDTRKNKNDSDKTGTFEVMCNNNPIVDFLEISY